VTFCLAFRAVADEHGRAVAQVMNYIDAPLTQMAWEEFVRRFEADHGRPWAPVRERINRMLGDTMRAAARLLEWNFCPDCTRACKYHPFFWNDVFHMLFAEGGERLVEGGWTRL
jgi:hypothetical protein